MAVDDVYLITVNANQFGTLRQNTLAFRATTEDIAEASDFLTIANAIKDLTRTNQHTSVTYTSWRARQISGSGVTWPETGPNCSPSGGQFFEGLLGGSLSGTDGGTQALPPQCALVVTLRSSTVGRSHRGRIYHYGFAEGSQDSGTWGGLTFGEVDGKWAAFMAAYAIPAPTIGYRLGVWSTVIASGCKRLPDGTHARVADAAPELAFTPVTSYLLRPVVYTQRRRVTGVGL